MTPIASAASSRSARLATVSPSMPSPNRSDTPSGSQTPSGPSKFDSGRPSRRPINSPMSSPRTAATNSAVDSASTWRMIQSAGTTVRYGRIAKPTTIQATTQAARKAPEFGASENG